MNVTAHLQAPEFVARLRRLELSLRARSSAQDGVRRGRGFGSSGEFADFRPYSHGDDLRHVDWNAYGRLDQMVIKQFQAQSRMQLVLVPELSTSMRSGEPSKLRASLEVMCALAWVAIHGHDALSLLPLSDAPAVVESLNHADGLLQRLDALFDDDAGPCTREHVNALLASLTKTSSQSLLVIATDMQQRDLTLSFVRSLRAQRRQVLVLNMASPQELQPSLDGFHLLEDAHGQGPRLRANITPEVRERYREEVTRYRQALADELRRCGAHSLNLCSDQPFETVIPALARAGFLRVKAS